MQQEFSADQARVVAASSSAPSADVAYEIPEGKGELFNRNFILLLIGQAVSLIGDSFIYTTLLVWAFTIIQAGPGSTAFKTAAIAGTSSAILSGLALPLLFGPFTGVFVDRWNRRLTMIISDIAQAIATLLPLVALTFFPSALVPALVVSVFLLNSCATVFLPSQFGVLQVIVSKRKLPQAIALAQVLVGVGGLIGTGIASPLFFKVGPIAAILGNALSFLVFAFLSAVLLIAASVTSFFMGMSQGAFQVGYLTVITDVAPKTIIGRTQASLAAMAVAAEFGMIILSGILGGFLSISIIFGAGAVLLLIAGVIGTLAVRQLQQRESQEASLVTPLEVGNKEAPSSN